MTLQRPLSWTTKVSLFQQKTLLLAHALFIIQHVSICSDLAFPMVRLIAFSLSNISTKNCQNQLMYVRVIA